MVDGPLRAGRVVTAGRSAVYLRFGADVLAVLTATAARVPCAITLAPTATLPPSLSPGRETCVGDGVLAWQDTVPLRHTLRSQRTVRREDTARWQDAARWQNAARGQAAARCNDAARWGDPARWELRPRRWWAPAVVQPGANSVGGAALLRRLLTHAGGAGSQAWLTEAIDEAARSLAAGRPEEAAETCLTMLGLGRGSTPSGDDAVAGLLLGARALVPLDAVGDGHGPARSLAALAERVAAAAPDRTTAVSAALLRHAAAGRAADILVHAVDVVVDRWPGPRPDEVLRRLLALGHGSGVDTATGLLAAADHLAVPV